MTESVRLLLFFIVLAVFVFGAQWARRDAKLLMMNGASVSRNRLSRFKWAILDSLSVLLWLFLVSSSMKYLALILVIVQTYVAFLSWREALSGKY
jgi:hypothetical protein